MISRIWNQLTQVLHLREPPRRTALAFAVGVAIAFSPAYGLHTALVFLCAWAFRLNFLALLSGNLMNNPWTFIPILGLTLWTGFTLTDTQPVTFNWDNLTLTSLYEQVMPYLLSFVVGGVVLGLLGAAISYPIAYVLISRYRADRWRKSSQEKPLPPGSPVG